MSEETQAKPSHKIKWTSEKVMSMSALFVSAISLFALFYQLNLAREENELIRKQQSASVLPYISQWISNANGLKVVFGNKGVGPAFIKKVSFTLNDTLKFNNSDDIFNHIYVQIKDIDSVQSFITSSFREGNVLPANQSITILHIQDKTTQNIFTQYVDKNSIDYKVVYEDVYGTQWSLSNKNKNEIPVLLTPED